MKKTVLIVLFWIISLIGAFTLKSNAQTKENAPWLYSDTTREVGRLELLADETTINYTKTAAKIECSNNIIHSKLYEKWQHAFVKYSWIWKKDRHGPYKQYTITVSKKDGDLIKEWAKTNL